MNEPAFQRATPLQPGENLGALQVRLSAEHVSRTSEAFPMAQPWAVTIPIWRPYIAKDAGGFHQAPAFPVAPVCMSASFKTERRSPVGQRTCMGRSVSRLILDHSISLFDAPATIFSSRPAVMGRWAQGRSRVAEGHREATCP